MKADYTLSKEYIKTRGVYNTNRYRMVPSERVAFAKNLTRKYGSVTDDAYTAGLAQGL